jgi:hypothetical protein
MSIKKYLARIEVPDPQPGPFAVRLKYELRRELFEHKKSWGWYPAFSTSLAGGLLAILSILVIEPHWATMVHASLFGRELPKTAPATPVEQPAPQVATSLPPASENPNGERIVNGIVLPPKSENPVRNLVAQADSTRSGRNSFPVLDEDKSYIVRRIQVSDNRSVYYVSELKAETPKVIY